MAVGSWMSHLDKGSDQILTVGRGRSQASARTSALCPAMLANKGEETALEMQNSVPWAQREMSSSQRCCVSALLWAGELWSGRWTRPRTVRLGSLALCLGILWPTTPKQSTGPFLPGDETRSDSSLHEFTQQPCLPGYISFKQDSCQWCQGPAS